MLKEALSSLKFYLTSFSAWGLFNLAGKTMKWRAIGEEKMEEIKRQGRSLIIVCWHGRMFFPIYYLRNRGIYGIVSPSRDGDYFSYLFSRFGWKIIRGSSKRGGTAALLSSLKVLKKNEILAITPDGPTGPCRRVHPGVIYLAGASQSPIIPVGASCNRKKVLKTWDESLIPYPKSSAVLVFGEPLKVPKNVMMAEIPELAHKLESSINEVTEEADRLVEEGGGRREKSSVISNRSSVISQGVEESKK